jgi:hypothetical protein
MSNIRFVIIQHDDSANVPPVAGRHGVLTPINMDGFYDRLEAAQSVASFMAEMRPDLETLIVSVVSRVTPPTEGGRA